MLYNILMPPIPPNNSEIDQALKEFEAKSNQEQAARGIITPQPSSVLPKEVEGVKFEIPSYGAVKYYEETDTPKIGSAAQALCDAYWQKLRPVFDSAGKLNGFSWLL